MSRPKKPKREHCDRVTVSLDKEDRAWLDYRCKQVNTNRSEVLSSLIRQLMYKDADFLRHRMMAKHHEFLYWKHEYDQAKTKQQERILEEIDEADGPIIQKRLDL